MSTHTAARTGSTPSIGCLFSRVATLVGRWLEARRAEAELNSMTDRELSDIGISRSEISSRVRGR